MQRIIIKKLFGSRHYQIFERNFCNEKFPPLRKKEITNPEKPSVHENMKPLEWLVGQWEGDGVVTYPTMKKPINYEQIILIRSVGQENFMYKGDTWTATDDKLLHKEYGFLRFKPASRLVQLVLVHNEGFLSVEEGFFTCGEIKFESVLIQRTPTSKNPVVKALERKVKFTDKEMKVNLYMATECTKIAHHFKATFAKF